MTIASLKQKSTYAELGGQLRYALYCIFHPADGFWCICRDKKASVASATIILIAFSIISVLQLTLSNFQFVLVPIEYFNAIITFLSTPVMIILWSVSNWSFTTLMNGKGKLSHIYIATIYAFTPMIIANTVGIVLSHLLTYDEGALYHSMQMIALIWTVMLLLVSMMQIHDYTMAKAVGSSILGIAGMGFILFLFMLFFSLISDAVMYFISIYNEIIFRMY
ncbi:MAG: YIP1 family protein [Oscillospiraceae bacterium]|nr:YIP1 family protein [Oscillospiraceae bacterium]